MKYQSSLKSPRSLRSFFLAVSLLVLGVVFGGSVHSADNPNSKTEAPDSAESTSGSSAGSSESEVPHKAQARFEDSQDLRKQGLEKQDLEDQGSSYEQILVLGTRSGTRSAGNSTTPIDVFDSSDISSVGGGGSMIQSLEALIPSFSSGRAFDGSAFVVPTTMRGGTADQTLVMLNGKRRHRSSVLHLFASPANRGAHGADIGMIPIIAIKGIEVLRDGAAAQYGSDAMAGVVNFSLKDASSGGSMEMVYGNHFEGEQNWRLSANMGTKLCDNGFLNLSMDTNSAEHLSRGKQHPDAQALIDQGLPFQGNHFNNDKYAQTWGRPALSGTRFFANSSCKLRGDRHLYAFGNYSRTKGDWSFFYRNIENRALTGTNSLSSSPVPVNLQEVHQLGFTPFLEGDQNDFSVTAGLKGDEGPWGHKYDLSVAMGMNTMDYTLKNSLNPNAPLDDGGRAVRSFDTADLKQEEMRFNADFSKNLDDYINNMVWTYGLEVRQEIYTQYPGSYPARVGGGVSGMPGTKLADAGTYDSTSFAAYTDFEHGMTDDLFMQYALRFEQYTNFGSTLTGKLAGHYSWSPALALRGSLSTGFRAPTPGQANLRATLTDFADRDTSDDDIEEIHVRHIPPESEKALELGGRALAEEKSINASVGAVSRISKNMRLSADIYQTLVTDRIYRNEIEGSIQNSENVVNDWSFYTNALDTRHTGLDLVWTTHIPKFLTSVSLAYNMNMVDVTGTRKINDVQVVRDDVIEDIENTYPTNKFIVTSRTRVARDWDLLLRARYIGAHYDDMGTIAGDDNGKNRSQEIDSTLFLDFEVTYNVMNDLSLVFGANNFLNTYPTEVKGENTAGFHTVGFPYSTLSAASYDGGSWYLKGIYTF